MTQARIDHVAHAIYNVIALNSLERADATTIVNFVCRHTALSDHFSGNEVRAGVATAIVRLDAEGKRHAEVEPYGQVTYMGMSLAYCRRTKTEIVEGSFSCDGDHVNETDIDEETVTELRERVNEYAFGALEYRK